GQAVGRLTAITSTTAVMVPKKCGSEREVEPVVAGGVNTRSLPKHFLPANPWVRVLSFSRERGGLKRP
ncbi:hypothetical protein GOODEAATRI_033251, partial [Goodea atripinnis]